MTRDDILKMEAGREMDALVAEKVMGIKVRVSDGEWELCARMDYADAGELMVDDTGLFYSERIHTYSTDIAAAWEVVEKLSDKVIDISRQLEGMTVETAHWDVEIDGHEAYALAVPLAICRAALLTVEVK
jgi:hypothetical protein